MRRLPAIFSDIDGVLVRGKYKIPRSDIALQYIRDPLTKILPKYAHSPSAQIPFVALTNGGGKLEITKANELNSVLHLTGPQMLGKKNLVMNFSPIRPIMKNYHNKIVLITGVGDVEEVALDCGLNKYVTCEEYAAIFPYLVPLSRRVWDDRWKAIENVKKRLKITDDKFFDDPFQIEAVFVLNDVLKWEENIQIILDLLTTTDGKIAQKQPENPPDSHIPVYCVNNDFQYADQFRLPRLAFGPFTRSLEHIYKLTYNKDIKIDICGKPFKVTFEYAKKVADELAETGISNCYMIGDNPRGDIRGANDMGWTSILVRTGVFEEQENCRVDPAKYVVKDFYDAVKLIFKLEGLDCKL